MAPHTRATNIHTHFSQLPFQLDQSTAQLTDPCEEFVINFEAETLLSRPIDSSIDRSLRRIRGSFGSSDLAMESPSGRLLSTSHSISQVYPTEPTPLHFTRLMYPKPSALLPPPSTSKKPRNHRSLLSCCCCTLFTTLCSLLFTLLFLLGLAALITWLVLRPIHAPTFSIDRLDIKTLNVTPQGTTLNADLVYTLVVTNSNKKLGFKYEGIDVETSYGGEVFGRSSVAGFSQGHRNVTTLTTESVVENAGVRNASAIAADSQRGSVGIHTRANAKVRVKVGAITSFPVKVHVDCDFTVKPPTATEPGSVITKTCKLTRRQSK